MTAKPILTNPDDIDRRVAHQFEDALRRAIAAGAKPPLTYMGAGMTGIVFCTRHEAFKVSRETRPLDRSFFTDEAEWLKAAKGVREHVARIRSFDAKHLVIRRECPQSDVPAVGRAPVEVPGPLGSAPRRMGTRLGARQRGGVERDSADG